MIEHNKTPQGHLVQSHAAGLAGDTVKAHLHDILVQSNGVGNLRALVPSSFCLFGGNDLGPGAPPVQKPFSLQWPARTLLELYTDAHHWSCRGDLHGLGHAEGWDANSRASVCRSFAEPSRVRELGTVESAPLEACRKVRSQTQAVIGMDDALYEHLGSANRDAAGHEKREVGKCVRNGGTMECFKLRRPSEQRDLWIVWDSYRSHLELTQNQPSGHSGTRSGNA